MQIPHVIVLLFLFIGFYLINKQLDKFNKEYFENILNLSPPISENLCKPPLPQTQYSYQINPQFCTGSLFCPNKDDMCINQHCVPRNTPPTNYFIQDCTGSGCVKPGLYP